MREVIATGRTVAEATEAGCEQLGLKRSDVSVEILEMPVKKLFKSIPAKVKVIADTQDAEPTAQPSEQKAEPAMHSKKQEFVAKPAQQPKTQSTPKLLPQEPEESIDLAANPRAAQAAQYLQEIFAAMGVADIAIEAVKQGDATLLRIDDKQISDKINIDGEVIQALSYLIDRSVNSGVEKRNADYLRVRLDIAGYRSRRETELLAIAERAGKEVAKTGRSKTLAPMNPYERLIVHTVIGEMEGIISESVGTDIERRVVIKSLAANATDGDDWRPTNRNGGGRNSTGRGKERFGGGAKHGHHSGGRGAGRNKKPSQPKSSTPEREYANKPHNPSEGPIVPKPREAVHDGKDLPLYGKIEL